MRCKVVKYCGKDCQLGDWAEHQKVCQKPSKNSNPRKPLETLLVDSEKTDQDSDDHFDGFYSSFLAQGKP